MEFSERVAVLRRALGFSGEQMAGVIGAKETDIDAICEAGGSGVLDRVLSSIEQAVDTERNLVISGVAADVLPKWLDCLDLENEDSEVEVVFHTRWPRFFGLVIDDLDASPLIEAGIPVLEMTEELGLGWMVGLFVDNPVHDPVPLLREAVRLKTAQAVRDMGG